MEPSKICHGSALTQEAKLFTNQRLNSEEFVVSVKVASALFSSIQDHHVLSYMFENAAGGTGSFNLHVPNQDHEVLDGSPAIVAADADDDNPAGQVTAPPVMGRRLFHSPTLTRYGSEPPKRSRVSSSNKASRKNCKPRFKVTFDMDFSREDTLLFNYLFSEGHPMEDTMVRIRECRLTRRHIETLIPGRPIDERVVEWWPCVNLLHTTLESSILLVPSTSFRYVSKGLLLDELTETYFPFWVKPSQFLNRIFIPVEDIFFHWYCVVVDFADKTVYHLDSYPDPNMIADRESLIRNMVERLHDLMTYPDYGPLRAFTPTNLHEWPIRRGQGIPNCNTSDSVAAWVISWLDPEGRFNALEISGVLDDSTLRGRTAVSLAGGPFNAIGSLVRMWAKQWQKLGISRK